MKDAKLQPGETVRLCLDECFKILFGNNDNILATELLCAVALGVDEKELRGRVKIMNPKVPNDKPKEKKSERDLVLQVIMNEEIRLLVEVNLYGKLSETISRRIGYYFNKVGSSNIAEGLDYADLPRIIALNFDNYSIRKDYDKCVDIYNLQSVNDHYIYPYDPFTIIHVNIEKCSNVWYTNFEEDDFNKRLIYFGAYINSTCESEQDEIMKKINTSLETSSNIRKAIDIMNEDKDLINISILKSRDDEMIYNGFKKEGIKEGIEKTNKKIVLNMYLEKFDVDTISRVTGLDINDIKEIIDNK